MTFEFESWRRKCKQTGITFTIISVVLGIEYSMTFATLWLYLKILVRPSQPIIYYSLISASYYVSMILFSLIVSRLIDRIRSVRTAILLCNFAVIIGNTLYALPQSPFFLLLGRFVSGAGGAIRPIMIGEVGRCFEGSESVMAFSSMGMGWACGFVFGPALNMAFVAVDFSIGSWKINYANFVGLFMAAVCTLQQILIFFYVHDLSKEYDPKAVKTLESIPTALENEIPSDQESYDKSAKVDITGGYLEKGSEHLTDENSSTSETDFLLSEKYNEDVEATYHSDIFRTDANSHNIPNISTIAQKLLFQIDPLLIMLCSALFQIVLVAIDIWLPLLVVDILHWTVKELQGLIFGTGISSVVVFIVLLLRPVSGTRSFYLSLFGVIMIIVIETSVILIRIYSQQSVLLMINWAIFCTFFGFCQILEDYFLVATLAKMVPTTCQSFAESIRIIFTRVGTMFSLLLAAPLFPWVVQVGIVFIALLCACVMALFARRERFFSPKLVM